MLPIAMGFGNPTEIAIIAGVIILLFGGAKLAHFGRSLGQGIREFKNATQDDQEAAASVPPVPSRPAPIVGQTGDAGGGQTGNSLSVR